MLTAFLKSSSIKSDFSHPQAHRSRKSKGHRQRVSGCDSHDSPRGDRGFGSTSKNVAWELGEVDETLETCSASALPWHRVQDVPQHSGSSLLTPTNAEGRGISTLTSMQVCFTGFSKSPKPHRSRCSDLALDLAPFL